MSSCLSHHACWLPRTVLFQKILIRSSFTTTSASDQSSSSHRSASRFSLKIARFLFLKRRMQDEPSNTSILPLSTYAHYSKRETEDDMQELARNFLLSLEPGSFEERRPTEGNIHCRSSTNSSGRTDRSGKKLDHSNEFCRNSSITTSRW